MATVQISGGVLHNLSADLRKALTSDAKAQTASEDDVQDTLDYYTRRSSLFSLPSVMMASVVNLHILNSGRFALLSCSACRRQSMYLLRGIVVLPSFC